jgi:hypothetical protein
METTREEPVRRVHAKVGFGFAFRYRARIKGTVKNTLAYYITKLNTRQAPGVIIHNTFEFLMYIV